MENNNNNYGTNSKVPSQNGIGEDIEYSPSRRNSTSSQQSSNATSPNYDSGNASDLSICLRPASISEDEFPSIEYGPDSRFQHLLHEKDQLLFLALQDVRRLKSELERINKSEKWYKSELRVQRNSRMEILEKLYTNERKFTQENQRLQNECLALLGKCSDIETQLEAEKELTANLLKERAKDEELHIDNAISSDFELEQNRQRLADQEQLINMLRNQKRSLLKDLQKLNCEKDEVIAQLESNVAQLRDENRTITKRCMQLVEAKVALEGELSTRRDNCNSLSSEVMDLQIIVKSLQEKLLVHISEQSQKDQEIESLKHELSQGQHSDEIAALLEKQHQHELTLKEQTVSSLNSTVASLQSRIHSLEDLHARYEQQKNEFDQVKRLLSERTVEFEKHRKLNATTTTHNITHQIISLTEENKKLYQQNEDLRHELDILQSKYAASSQSLELDHLQKTKENLNQLSDKYLEVCELYEKSKFESDMKDIQVEKFKFEKEKDTREIEELREKLVEASKKFECQKSLTTEFEFALSRVQQEKHRLEAEIKCNRNQNAELKTEANCTMEEFSQKDGEIEKLKTALLDPLRESKSHSISVERESRVNLIQRLLTLQSEKVDLLNAEQCEWENTLAKIDLGGQNTEPESLASDFENLNQLLHYQNSELAQLNEVHLQQTLDFRKSLETTEQDYQTVHEELESAKQKITTLEQQLLVLENVSVDYQKQIADLAIKNNRLVEEFNVNFSRERESHSKQARQLKSEFDTCSAENIELNIRLQQLESEVKQLRSCQAPVTSCESQHKREDIVSDRILYNVLETEHRRKMSRYDVHIRSLLSTIKSYKKNLQIAEERYETLQAKTKEMVHANELQAMESSLQEMRLQFECSQKEINNLKHQLKTMREEFCGNGTRKISATMDLTNLMDDYKKCEWENTLAKIDLGGQNTEPESLASDFENLNQLLHYQNSELAQLNEVHLQQTLDFRKSLETTEQDYQTVHEELESAKQKITTLEQQLLVLENVSVDYQKQIADLAIKNNRLVEEFNVNFSRERESHSKQARQLKSEFDTCSAENIELNIRLQQLESEVKQLRSCQAPVTSCESQHKREDIVSDRILYNVLETEHRRKMSRYDVHIRSLLSTIKSYKKNLQIAEERYETLQAKTKEMVHANELQAMESSLQEMRLQFECSQKEINNLKHQLKTMREEFCGNGTRKISATMDLTNLMDDYKKLIQQSQSATRRPSTSDIYQLIEKSNKFVPKLTNISTSLSGLREDIQQVCAVVNQPSAGRGSPPHKMSLMDELKLAESTRLC